MKSQQFNICQRHFAEMALENFTKHFRKPNLIRMRLGSIEGSVANNVFEGNKGFYLRVPQTRIVNFTGVFQLGPT